MQNEDAPLPAECPQSPNCVSTTARRASQAMSPLEFSLPENRAMSEVRACIRRQPGARIVSEKARYLHAEFRSAWMGFVDDVEFFIVPDQRLIHFRSASRTGYSDLGVNRRRMEQISRELAAVDGLRIKS